MFQQSGLLWYPCGLFHAFNNGKQSDIGDFYVDFGIPDMNMKKGLSNNDYFGIWT